MDSEDFDLSIKTLKGEVFTVSVSSKDTVGVERGERAGDGGQAEAGDAQGLRPGRDQARVPGQAAPEQRADPHRVQHQEKRLPRRHGAQGQGAAQETRRQARRRHHVYNLAACRACGASCGLFGAVAACDRCRSRSGGAGGAWERGARDRG